MLALAEPVPVPPWRSTIVAESPALRRLLDQVERIAPSNSPVILQGETGAGKEVLARAIHAASGRAGPFVPVNCAALPASLAESELLGHVRGAFTGAERTRDGLVQRSHGGTLLLDEVADLDLGVQAKLLRVIEDGVVRRVGSTATEAVDLRVVCATNRSLAAAVEAGTFRHDLYHRLAGVVLTIPPLRERPEDIEPLVRHFLADEAVRVPDAVLDDLRRRAWPGNVRELRQAVRRAVLLGGPVLTSADFADDSAPSCAAEPGNLSWLTGRRWEEIERDVLAWAVGHHGTVRAAAHSLGIPRSTLADRLRKRGVVTARAVARLA